ncbi:MAG: type II secretion system major pseudopilin GspG [Planctomycetota bacterium]
MFNKTRRIAKFSPSISPTRRHRRAPSGSIAGRRAFTLVELLLALTLLVVIGGIVASSFSGTQDRASRDAARSSIGLIKVALDRYRFDMNVYPSDLDELWEKPREQKSSRYWKGPYVDRIKLDPWGNEYEYRQEGSKNSNAYDFWSPGPDGRTGTDDDIGNWESEG